MSVAEIRRHNLNQLVETRFKGVAADLARAIGRDDAQVWQLLNGPENGGRNIGERIARIIETALGLQPGDLDRIDMHAPSGEPYARGAPVVGTAQLGDEGFHMELDYPVGHGDGFVRYPTRDPNAYALRVRGDSMRPRIKPGEFVLVEPNHALQAGEEVLVRTIDGRVMVKVLDFRRDGVVQLSSVNEQHRPMTFDENEIERIHFVAAILKASLYYKALG